MSTDINPICPFDFKIKIRQGGTSDDNKLVLVHVFGPRKQRVASMADQNFNAFLGQQQFTPVFLGAQPGIAIQIGCFVKQPVHFGAIPCMVPPETGPSPGIRHGGSAYSSDGHRHYPDQTRHQSHDHAIYEKIKAGPCVLRFLARYRVREAGRGRTARQPGQDRKVAAVTSFSGSRFSLSPFASPKITRFRHALQHPACHGILCGKFPTWSFPCGDEAAKTKAH